MRKLFYSINITIDGFADHTNGIADDELHEFFSGLIEKAGVVLFGRKTYQLLESYWPAAVKDPGLTAGMLKFARVINGKPKIVFSETLDKAEWNNTKLISENAVETIAGLKQQQGKDLSIGGISLASELARVGLIDEYWFVVHPFIAGSGRHLFENMDKRINIKFIDSTTFKSGVIVLHYLKKD